MSSFLQECAWLYRHKGVLVVLFGAPLLYALFYPLPFRHAVVDDIPTIVWDAENSVSSREWIYQIDASPKLKVIATLPGEPNMDELNQFPEAQFFVHFPADSSELIAHQQQVKVPYGAKADNFLVYSTGMKAFTLALKDINASLRADTFYRIEENAISADMLADPIDVNIVEMYNAQASYMQYLVPSVFIVLAQQVLVMALGMHWGYRFEMNRPIGHPLGVWATHLVLYSLQGLALVIFFFRLMLPLQGVAFTADGFQLLWVALPFILGAVGFGMVFTVAFKEQETALVWCLPVSVPLLMMAGVSWPEFAMADWVAYLSHWIPSTWGVNALIDAAYLDHQPDMTIGWRNAIAWLSLGLLLRYVAVDRWQAKDQSTA